MPPFNIIVTIQLPFSPLPSNFFVIDRGVWIFCGIEKPLDMKRGDFIHYVLNDQWSTSRNYMGLNLDLQKSYIFNSYTFDKNLHYPSFWLEKFKMTEIDRGLYMFTHASDKEVTAALDVLDIFSKLNFSYRNDTTACDWHDLSVGKILLNEKLVVPDGFVLPVTQLSTNLQTYPKNSLCLRTTGEEHGNSGFEGVFLQTTQNVLSKASALEQKKLQVLLNKHKNMPKVKELTAEEINMEAHERVSNWVSSVYSDHRARGGQVESASSLTTRNFNTPSVNHSSISEKLNVENCEESFNSLIAIPQDLTFPNLKLVVLNSTSTSLNWDVGILNNFSMIYEGVALSPVIWLFQFAFYIYTYRAFSPLFWKFYFLWKRFKGKFE